MRFSNYKSIRTAVKLPIRVKEHKQIEKRVKN